MYFKRIEKLIVFIIKYFPVLGGYSVKDLDDMTKDPEHYNYRGNSWFKKQEDNLLKNKKK